MFKNFRSILLGFTILVFCFGTIAEFKKTEKSTNNDFRVYYKTSARIGLKDWDHIYTRDDGAMPYRYVPYTLMTISWLSHYEEVSARKIWLCTQVAFFALGLYVLYLGLMMLDPSWGLEATCFSFLLMFRYYIDSLFCGQVACLIFLCFSLGLYFYLKKETFKNGLANFFPASLKIIPGLQLIHAFIKAPGISKKLKLVGVCALIFFTVNLACYFWLLYYAPEANTNELFVHLWKNWLSITLADGDYFDGRTAKSQAFRGVLLRLLGKGSITEILWKFSFVSGLTLVFINWGFKKASNLYQDACSYCLGILSFVIFMPESLPYQIMKVIIPLGVMLCHPKFKESKSVKATTVAVLIFMTLSTTDLIGRANAEWIQYMSFPFVVIVMIFSIMFKESWDEKKI